MQDRLFADPELVQFYDIENGWADDTRYCLALAKDSRSVLDLGCGTGLLAAALGHSRDVVGVDPAGAMLDVARAREGGAGVTWVEADARTVRSGRRFDLIVLTGHAFQCFLTDEDQRAVARTIAAHLEPDGTFVFDSRNPACEEWREWTPELSRRIIRHPRLGQIEAWNDVAFDAGREIATYGTFYRAEDGRLWEAQSSIRFASMDTIATGLHEAGLIVKQWLGNWQGEAFRADASEMIAVGRLG
ncbi:trans-aconitate 2-methyltransferase [Aestuariivirga sp.]|uniref:class I SAM-dependent methyltransferase n=1 Tax=Aestuariivirga sp. TaxID=2650926 RepID=UPI003592F75F